MLFWNLSGIDRVLSTLWEEKLHAWSSYSDSDSNPDLLSTVVFSDQGAELIRTCKNAENKMMIYCSASQTCPGGPPALHILYVSLIRHTQKFLVKPLKNRTEIRNNVFITKTFLFSGYEFKTHSFPLVITTVFICAHLINKSLRHDVC